jgi:hypothetical protein
MWRAAALALAGCVLAHASADGGGHTPSPVFEITSYCTTGAGGGIASGCNFEIGASVGQTVVGPIQGGAFAAVSGFMPDRDDADACQPTDLDCSGMTDGGDISLVVLSWGECACGVGCLGDVDWSGSVDGGDLSFILLSWGE